MQNAFQKPEIILAYTAHAGSRFGEERGADERGEIRFGVATVSESACDGSSGTATRRNTAFRRSMCPELCRVVCMCVFMRTKNPVLANHLLMPISWGAADSVFTCCCYGANTRV